MSVVEIAEHQNRPRVESLEIDLVVNAIVERYGYDFRDYARASLKRRLINRVKASELSYISELVPRVLHDKSFFAALLKELSITVTDLFRDPSFYGALREHVLPRLRTYPFFKIWHAGCATGEEVYSMAIMLEEAGLYDRAQIYGTDFNNLALDTAREAAYPLERLRQGTANYNKSCGNASLADYFQVDGESVRLREELKRNITFANHNLAVDSVFGEMHVVICRNVVIYFNRSLQDRVFRQFTDSLCPRGFLGLGSKETLEMSAENAKYEAVVSSERIYQKVS